MHEQAELLQGDRERRHHCGNVTRDGYRVEIPNEKTHFDY